VRFNNYLPEFSALLGNDYIHRLHGNSYKKVYMNLKSKLHPGRFKITHKKLDILTLKQNLQGPIRNPENEGTKHQIKKKLQADYAETNKKEK
jgi:hypothetical protein